MRRHKQRKKYENKRIIIEPHEIVENEILITDHAVEQWNERTDHNIDGEYILNVLKESASLEDGFIHMWQDYYCLFDDIVVCMEREKITKQIQLTTVYGRISLVPALNDIRRVVQGIHKYGKINLSLDQNTPLQSI